MIRNYLKAAWRNLLKNKSFSFINILGLAIGMASAILIFLWIYNQVSHDRFHEKTDRIFVMNNRDHFSGNMWAWSSTPKIMGPTLKQDYPEVEEFARTNNCNFFFTLGEKKMQAEGLFTDPGFFKMFSFPLIKGNISDALSSTNKIVLTEKFAGKLFGDEDPIGKTVKIDSAHYMVVSGILKDFPNNTIFRGEYLLPWLYMKKLGWDDQFWGNNSIRTFILLKQGVNQQGFDKKIKNITINHSSKAGETSTTEVFTQNLGDSWLYSKPVNGYYTSGRIEMVRLFTIVAGFILLIACINFMNLSTARSEKRAREVGIRKVVGAPRIHLIIQFISESILLSFIAGIVALILVLVSLKGYNQLVGIELSLDFSSPGFWLVFILFILFTGILAGSYPAFFLSSFKPVKVLKGTFKKVQAAINPRKVLVVLQFTFAVILIICTIIVKHQINFALSRDSGYSRDQLVYSYLQGETEKNYLLIRNELLSSGAAVSVSKNMSPITQRYSDGWGYEWQDCTEQDKKIDFIRMSADADFTRTMGVKLIEGRDIDIYKYATDSNAMLINETALKLMRIKNPVGQIIKGDGGTWHIIGVIKDFIFESPYAKVNPLFVLGPKSWFNVMHYKLNPAKTTEESLRIAGEIFKKYNPEYPFQYTFTDDSYAEKFKEEQRTGTLASLFAGLTIFISCLGLFGLAAYMAENRTKEIGIRKVLGASIYSITSLLSIDFLKLVVLSFLIASPVAWYAMNLWLKNYDYRIEIEWWTFVLASMLTILIALGTVSFQAIRAAMTKPVRSLRTE
ncbi:ABC transporter permease [Pararcticibacter amylolyticus]|uniref:ABC transporter permease n=1 Tax=Pararcticibacter amylolyticus TaxID=2173175 RepID=A0A2U2PAS2_9SPHI|nr:ABC transporter permease [Pararcticibacter amylolyticus]PWG78496.1 ABC transporter permease [Pararcticibacter amylolyticus]